jgi:hypothetical protein
VWVLREGGRGWGATVSMNLSLYAGWTRKCGQSVRDSVCKHNQIHVALWVSSWEEGRKTGGQMVMATKENAAFKTYPSNKRQKGCDRSSKNCTCEWERKHVNECEWAWYECRWVRMTCEGSSTSVPVCGCVWRAHQVSVCARIYMWVWEQVRAWVKVSKCEYKVRKWLV